MDLDFEDAPLPLPCRKPEPASYDATAEADAAFGQFDGGAEPVSAVVPFRRPNYSTPVAPMGRTLPHSIEAEEYLLSCCMLDGADVIARCRQAGVTAGSFYLSAHGVIFDTIQGLFDKRAKCIDVSTVAEELKTAKRIDEVGGYPFLTQVSSRIPTTAQAGYFIEKVRELATLREIIRTATGLVEGAYQFTGGIEEFVSSAKERVSAIADTVASPQGKQSFAIWAPSQFLAFELDPSACLLGEGFVEKGEWTSFVGVGGLGKTRLALYFAVCQISGQPWCGLATGGDPQRTIILSTENGVRRWKYDLGQMFRGLDDVQRAAVESHLGILALTAEDDGDLCLGNPEAVERLRTTLAAQAPGLVIFDPFADMIDGDENKTSDVVATLRVLRNLTRSACPAAAVLIIHHARTGAANVAQAGDNFSAGNFGRGSKALYSRVRCELQLAPQDRDDPNRLVLACGKANNTVKFEARGIVFNAETFSYGVDPDFDLNSWRDDVAGKRKQTSLPLAEIVDAVRELAPSAGDETTTAQVHELLGDSGAQLRTVQRKLTEAVNKGYLLKGKKRSHWRLGAKPMTK